MKELRKMLLINWHYFSHTEVNFRNLNFLTGSNAAGKSTLIDALQVVMLGETKSTIFNKAANQKSERTLIGYLKGEMGDDGKTGFRYLREGDFHAYILLEFYDQIKKKSFTAGVAFDVFSDNTEKHYYFIADLKIPDHGFLKKDIPYTRDEFRSYLKRETKNRAAWFDTQNAYRRGLMAKCGQIKLKFFSLFKKAVPFTPITNIEQFITEYITDIKGRPDIESMQENLRYYKRLEKDAGKIEKRIELLKTIYDKHHGWKSKRRLQKKQELMVALGEREKSENALRTLITSREKALEKQGYVRESLKALHREKEELEKRREALTLEKAESDLHKTLSRLDAEENTLEQELAQKTGERRDTLKHLRVISEQMIALQEKTLPFSLDDAKHFADLSPEQTDPGGFDALKTLNETLKLWESHYQQAYFRKKTVIEEREKSIEEKQQRLSGLKKGVKDYPKEVHELVNQLKNHGLKDVKVLSDLLELKDEAWRTAIEGYLHTQRFYVFVREEDYERALRIYEGLRNKAPVYQVGLVDVEKIRQKKRECRTGSLGEKVTTDDPRARVFIDYVLGSVMACEKVEELRRNGKSITRAGMLYQNYVARQMDPKRWEIHYIGRDAIKQQIQRLEEELQRDQEFLLTGKARLKEIQLRTGLKPLSEVELDVHASRLHHQKRIREVIASLEKLRKERNRLDLSYLDRLEKKLMECRLKLAETDEKTDRTNREEGKLSEEIRHLTEITIPSGEKDLKRKEEALLSQEFDEVREESEKEYGKRREEISVDALIANYERSAKAASTDKERLWAQLVESRGEYNRLYHQSYDLQKESNVEFDKTMSDLSEIRLPEYLEKIREAEKKATLQFKEDFLSKLKDNFDTVEQQIRELNRAIKDSPFGRDRYRFVVKPKPEMLDFYNMINDELLMGSGMSILNHAYQKKHQGAIDELFRLITDAEGDPSGRRKSELEQNISYYTNYQSYLNFDLLVTDEDGETQRLSKTLLKKSGGETQTPFYLSVLASFAHLYRVNQKGSQSETIRLIVFDEAFNKMDQQRIEESLKLLREFGLQAIISAPPDKMEEIAPFADQNLLVLREGNYSFVQEFTNKEVIREFA